MRRFVLGAWLSFAGPACDLTLGPQDSSSDGGDVDASSTGTCSAALGSYQASYQEQSGGTCGPQATGTLVFDGTNSPSPDCTGDYQTTSDGCRDTFQVRCPYQPGQIARRSGSLEWNSGGTKGTGTVTVSIASVMTDSSGQVTEEHLVCTSTYAVAYIKL